MIKIIKVLFSICKVYLTGDKVIYGGLYYKARWWNSATQPNPDATDDVWEVLGNSCDGIQVEAVVAEEDSDEDNNDEGAIEDGDKEGVCKTEEDNGTDSGMEQTSAPTCVTLAP